VHKSKRKETENKPTRALRSGQSKWRLAAQYFPRTLNLKTQAMNKLFHWVLVILLLETAIVAGRAEPSEQTMREASVTFLKAVIGDVLQNPETAKYFPGVKLKDISLNDEKEPDGRLVRWDYRYQVHEVPGDPNAQLATKTFFESKASIIFSVFVANEKNGHGLFLWDKSYRVLADSSLVAGFGVKMEGDSSDLKKAVDGIFKSHLVAFQRAVSLP
jgi:hypothetical protein